MGMGGHGACLPNCVSPAKRRVAVPSAVSPVLVQRALDSLAADGRDVSIDHRGGEIPMAEQLLDGSDVVSRLQHVRGEAVTLMPGPALSSLCRVPDYAGWDRRAPGNGRILRRVTRHNQRLVRKAKRRS